MHNPNKWHFKKKFDLVEWKYFNISSKKLKAFFSYIIFDKRNIVNPGKVMVLGRIYKNGRVYGSINNYTMDDVRLNKKEVSINKNNKIKAIGNESLHITGGVNDVSWDLMYKDLTHGFSDLIYSGSFKLGNMHWVIEIPCAKVKGWVKIKNKKYNINSLGYSDGNWGAMFTPQKWGWLQFNQYKNRKSFMSVYVGDILNSKEKKVVVEFDGEKTRFDRSKQIMVNYFDFKGKLPSKIKITADNGVYRLILDSSVYFRDKITSKQTFFMPDFVLFENLNKIKAKLYKKQRGKFKLIKSSAGKGFSEFTVLKHNELKKLMKKI